MPLDKGWAGVVRTMAACQCASLRPGISTRPPPAMIWVSARRSVGIGPAEILSMMLPLIRTLDGADSVGCVPSNIRTFSMTVTAERSCASADTAESEAAVTTPHASPRSARRLGILMFPPLLALSLSANSVALPGKRPGPDGVPRRCGCIVGRRDRLAPAWNADKGCPNGIRFAEVLDICRPGARLGTARVGAG